jgi:hypothetical protein
MLIKSAQIDPRRPPPSAPHGKLSSAALKKIGSGTADIDTPAHSEIARATSIFLLRARRQFSANQIFRIGGNARTPEISAAPSTQKIGDRIPRIATAGFSSLHKYNLMRYAASTAGNRGSRISDKSISFLRGDTRLEDRPAAAPTQDLTIRRTVL